MSRSKNAACSECGRPVSKSGREPKSGARFCLLPDCQAAKQRLNYSLRTKQFTKPAPTECASCHDELPARSVRITDSPLGRWCRKAGCQRHRMTMHLGADPEKAARTLKFVTTALEPDGRIDCERCGRQGAVFGFTHPKPGVLEICEGVGTIAPGPIAKLIWPDAFA